MKSTFNYLLALVSILLIYGCSNEIDNVSTDAKAQWTIELDKVISKSNEAFAKNGLEFMGYKEAGVVTSGNDIQNIKNKYLSDECLFPYYASLDQMRVVTLEEVRSYPENNVDVIEMVENQLDAIVSVGVKVVELNWRYNGSQNINSICLFSEKTHGFLYDNLISNIITNIEVVSTTSSNKDEVLTRENDPIFEYNVTKEHGLVYRNTVDTPLAWGLIYCKVYFKSVYGTVQIDNFNLWTDKRDYLGVYTDARCRPMTVELGSGGRIYYIWASAIDRVGPLQIIEEYRGNGIYGYTANISPLGEFTKDSNTIAANSQ